MVKNALPSFLRSLHWGMLLLWPSLLFCQPDINIKQAAVNNLRKGDYLQALEKLNLAIQQEPGLSDLWFLRGYAKYGLDDYLGAEQDYSRSIELSPYMTDVFINRAVVRSQLSNHKGALEDYARALELSPDNPDIYVNRARTNLFLKKYYSSLIDCNKAILLKVPGETVYVIRGCARQGIRRYEEALEDLNQAITINPKSITAFTQRGLVWLDLEKPDSAIRDFTRVLEIDSLNTFALFNRALTLSKKPDPAAALRDLDQVVRLSPYNSYAYYNRAIVLISLNDKKGAIRDFTYVSRLEPKNIMSYYYRSRLKNDLKDYQGALEDLDRTLELLPEYADAFYDRYEIKMKLKDTKGAKEDYRRASELAEKNHYAPDSLRTKKKDYYESITKLSGDFDVAGRAPEKIQNQSIEIHPLPLFRVFLGRADFSKVKLYDAYQKKHYYGHIVVLSNQEDLMEDSLILLETARLTRKIDTTAGDPVSHFERGVLLASARNYTAALKDFDTTLQIDSGFLLAWFSKANTRYELIRIIRSQETMQNEITIMTGPVRTPSSLPGGNLEHTLDAVLRDYDKVIVLDPSFPYGHYNRGVVNCMMGNYRDAETDFTAAIRAGGNFAEAYYNRGLIRILLEENGSGCEDLSRAGELGIKEAYQVMRRYCYK